MLPSINSTVSAPGIFLSRLDGRPVPSPTDASPLASQPSMHGSGPMRFAIPSSYRTFTDYSLPVSRRTEFRIYYNEHRVHQSLSGSTPGERSGEPSPAYAVLDHYAWRHHCRGLFQLPIAA